MDGRRVAYSRCRKTDVGRRPICITSAQCAAPGFHIRWDFGGSWEAIGVEGIAKGTKTKSSVDGLTLEKWNFAVAGGYEPGCAFEASSAAQRKQATFHFLGLHLERALLEQGV